MNARPELSNDIWLIITEWILLQSDLKSLCLVSRNFNALATPRLYDTVKIPLWDEKAVATFLRSVGTGAGRHLNRTRHLIIESEETSSEALSILPNSIDLPDPRYCEWIVGDDVDADAVRTWIDAVLNSDILETLHLSCDDDSPLQRCMPKSSIRAPNLLTFAYHNGPNSPGGGSDHHSEADFLRLHNILSGFPKLQALGWKIGEGHFIQENPSQQSMDDAFMEALQGVPDLRILHLRQGNYLHRDRYFHDRALNDEETLAFHTHRWANAFFSYMHKRRWSPKLTALIIRCYMTEDNSQTEYVYSPQHCFVKGYQTDVFGRSATVAVPVTRPIVKAIEPRADLLDYDPECNIFGENFANSRRM
ncbi:hypothetical protein BKA63DRAFT_426788 [Paraphoma chrysanthemicola]|nr:hypothetical protein BKA63DRAFT_426788 [Paraphoma chrysanthemicola]